MSDLANYFIIERKAVPDVLLKVVQAKKLVEKEKTLTIQEAVDQVGISRSSFYKYKDSIFPFYDNARGSTITLSLRIDDEPGILSRVLNTIADYKMNILTIHQAIPINGIANISISIQLLETSGDIYEMMNGINGFQGIYEIKILSSE
jgi:chorismate mutase